MPGNPDDLEQALGYRFRDRGLLLHALTHSSSTNEVAGGAPKNNERLEFLGDSVLGLLVSEWLFQRFADFNEGQLSLLKNRLVSAAHLLDTAHRLELGSYLQLGRGEELAGGRTKQRLLVNALEAVIAAMFLDGGAEAVRDMLVRYAMPDQDELARLAGSGPPRDFRAELDRLSRDRDLPKPEYQLVSEFGPGHARTFTVEVRVGASAVKADGPSKKSAAHNAARELLQLLGDAE